VLSIPYGRPWHCFADGLEPVLPYRIQRWDSPKGVVFSLSGEMDGQHAAQLDELLRKESNGRIILDLEDVTFVDHDAVRYLARAECARIQIVNCPEYVRSWIAAERGI
jgi:anti-anti-sigma factor